MGYPESRRLTVGSWSGSIGVGGILLLAYATRAGVIATPPIQPAMPAVNSVTFQASTVDADHIILGDADHHSAALLGASLPYGGLRTESQRPTSSQMSSEQSVSGIEDVLIDPSAAFIPAPSQSLPVNTTGGDAATAIPLPPAVQSGITGIAALGLAGLFRCIRRALR